MIDDPPRTRPHVDVDVDVDIYVDPDDDSEHHLDDGGSVDADLGVPPDLVARLRAGLADRVPPALRPVAPSASRAARVPRGAAMAALVVALVLSAALISRELGDDGGGGGGAGAATVPARRPAAVTHPVGGADAVATRASGGGTASGGSWALGAGAGSPAETVLVLDVT